MSGTVDNEDRPSKSLPLDEKSKQIIEFGNKVWQDSISIVNDFVKIMIPLSTGLITAYLALLQLTPIESTNNTILLPAYLILAGLSSFIVVKFPFPGAITLGNLNSISEYRKKLLWWRFIGACIGATLFVVAIFFMIYVLI